MTLVWLDLIAGSAIPAVVLALFASGRMGRATFQRWVLGFAIGLTWEIPFGLAGDSLVRALAPWPVPIPLAQNICHSFYDALLFETGVALCLLLLRSRSFLHTFRASAQLVMLAWGLGSEILVDVVGTGSLWEFQVSRFNPVILHLAGKDLTLIPQLVWVVAPFAYYAAILAAARRAPSA